MCGEVVGGGRFLFILRFSGKMSLKNMVASTSEDTGQNSVLGKLKGASSSGGNKAAEIAPPSIKGKFDKAKRETKSPSLERGKLCEDEAIEVATPTQGLTQAMEVQLEDDKQKHDEAIFGKTEGNATDSEERDYINRQLEKEKEKRRDVEDSVDMLRKKAD